MRRPPLPEYLGLGALFSQFLVYVEEPEFKATPERNDTSVLVRRLTDGVSGLESAASDDRPPRETARGSLKSKALKPSFLT